MTRRAIALDGIVLDAPTVVAAKKADNSTITKRIAIPEAITAGATPEIEAAIEQLRADYETMVAAKVLEAEKKAKKLERKLRDIEDEQDRKNWRGFY